MELDVDKRCTCESRWGLAVEMLPKGLDNVVRNGVQGPPFLYFDSDQVRLMSNGREPPKIDTGVNYASGELKEGNTGLKMYKLT